tara:strand:- start:186 stop:314 length:129 start_codon:yes stop_codon:yes gene_type:complete
VKIVKYQIKPFLFPIVILVLRNYFKVIVEILGAEAIMGASGN